MKNILLLFSILVFTCQGFAIELFQQGLSTRSQAMGGTSIAFARGTDAIFYNPAALAKVEGFSLNILTAGAALSTNAITKSDQLAGSGAITAADLNELYGERFFTDATAYGGLVVPYIGVGAYSYNTSLMTFNNPAFPTFNVDFTSDYAYVVAGAVPIGNNFSLGVAGRHVKRWQGVADIPVGDLLSSNAQDVIEANIQSKGKGNALDVAAMYSYKGSWNIDVATVWKDLGDTKFTPTLGNGPVRQENNLMFGGAVQKDLGLLTWTNAFEYKFIRNNGNITKKLHLGTEVSLPLIDIRAGYGQGYLSYGVGIDLWFLQVDVATYTGELGATAGQSPSDRYQASISLNLDFDQSFKLSKDGKKRRLLQRR